jgi:hypothetical protein
MAIKGFVTEYGGLAGDTLNFPTATVRVSVEDTPPPLPALSISDAPPVLEGDSGTTQASFVVTLNPPPLAYDWVRQVGGSGVDTAHSLAADPAGDVFVMGTFTNAATFGNSTLVSQGGLDIFLTKFDSSGRVLWARGFGGSEDDAPTGFGRRGLAADGAGNLLLSATFAATLPLGTTNLASSGGKDGFVAKVSPGGDVLWAKRSGAQGDDGAFIITADASGNVYGTQGHQLSLWGVTLTNAGGWDLVVWKLDPSGNPLWIKQTGGTNDDVGRAIALDPVGNVYVSGYFKGRSDLWGTILNSRGDSDIFLAKLDPTGKLLWATQAGGSGTDYPFALVVNAAGELCLAGTFSGTATFGGTNLTSNGGSDIFVAKYDASGNLIWATRAGSTGDDYINDLSFDAAGNIYVVGTFLNATSFGGTTLRSAGSQDAYIASLDKDGKWRGAQRAGGVGLDTAVAVGTDTWGHVYFTGRFSGSATFDSEQLQSVGETDVFVARLASTWGQETRVDYATADGTATTNDLDYVAVNDTLVFQFGETNKAITVPVIGDTKPEPDETFYVNLTNPVNATIGKPQGQGTILNDDTNACPTISQIPDQTINEDTTSSAIPFAVADPETPPDRLAVSASSWDTGLIPDRNILIEGEGTNRTVRITPAHDQFGKAMIMVTVADEAGCTTGEPFEVTVNPVNDPPTLDPIGDLVITEDAPMQTVKLTGISPGPPNEIQTLVVAAISSNPALIPDPVVTYTSPSATGILTFTSVTNANGTNFITVVVKDDGGRANGGIDAVTNTFRVIVRPVNDPPSFTKGPDLTVTNTAGPQTVVSWATAISAGPPDEADQTLSFVVTNDREVLFSVQPVISPTGTLTFTPARDTNGTATVTVILKDNVGRDNGGADTSASQTLLITVQDRTNLSPTVVLTSPANGALFPAGTNLVISARASDADGYVTQVEFFQGASSKLGEVAASTNDLFSLLWTNVPPGKYTLTARATDDSGTSRTSDPVEITVQNSLPPSVQIVTPASLSIFCQHTLVEVAATAAAKEGSIARLEIYVGPELVARAASSTCSVWLPDLLVGDYVLTAQAVDVRGLSSTSAVVNIAVVEAVGCLKDEQCRLEAAVIASAGNPEVGWMQTNLFEAGLRSRVEDRSNLTYEALTNSALIVWHGLGADRQVLTPHEVGVLQQAFANGIPLYFIGDSLASAAQGLSEPWRSQWQELIHLSAPTGRTNAGEIIFPDTSSKILNGRFGEVSTNVTHTEPVEVATATSDFVALGFCGGADVLAASPEGAEVRSVTQNFPILGGADPAALEERKKLFQNAVFWLLKCTDCTTYGLTISGVASADSVSVCSPLVYTNKVQHNGECMGTGIMVTNWLPAGVTFESAEVSQGYYWREENGPLMWYVGHLTSASHAEIRLTVIPYLPGRMTNVAWVRGNGEYFDEGNRGDIVTEVVGEAVDPPQITRQPQGQTVEPGSSVTLSVEALGTLPLAYEWHRDGGTLSNASSALLVITNAQPDNAGSYTVVVRNCAGSVTSSNAPVTVNRPGLRFKSIVPLGDGSVQLMVVGKVGQRFVLQSSADVVTWAETPATGGTNVLGTPASVSLIDSNALHLPARFYRVKLVQ